MQRKLQANQNTSLQTNTHTSPPCGCHALSAPPKHASVAVPAERDNIFNPLRPEIHGMHF